MALNWIIIAILIVLVLMFLKFRHIKHRLFAVLLIVLLIFFYTTATKLFSEQQINLKSFDGIVSAGKIYFSWLGHAVKNIVEVTNNVIKMDWAGNLTNLTGK